MGGSRAARLVTIVIRVAVAMLVATTTIKTTTTTTTVIGTVVEEVIEMEAEDMIQKHLVPSIQIVVILLVNAGPFSQKETGTKTIQTIKGIIIMATIVEAEIKNGNQKVEAMVTTLSTIVEVMKRITLTKLEVIPTPLCLVIAVILKTIIKLRTNLMYCPRNKWIVLFS